MNQFGTLYHYECKKILSRKIVRISFSVCIVIIIISLFAPLLGDYYIDGNFIDSNYNMYKTDKKYAKALSGREINQSLIEETMAAYSKIPETPGKHYTATKEYQQYARPYSEIYSFVRRMSGLYGYDSDVVELSWLPSEGDLYFFREIKLESAYKELRLSEEEMDFWKEREAQIKTPYVYEAHEGYSTLISSYQTVGLFVLMFLSICLSGMFADEHARKTDQIILSSPLGKAKLYWAKMAAGVSIALISTILFFGFTALATLGLYGAEGCQAAFQFIYPSSSDPITCGQAVLIAYGDMLFAAVIISVFVMVLSELLHSNIATLAVSTGLLIIEMIVNVPEQYRVLAQIWDWFPWCFATPWNVFGKYTISLFGHHLAAWQAVPMIYLPISVALAVAGKPIYERFQVSGR